MKLTLLVIIFMAGITCQGQEPGLCLIAEDNAKMVKAATGFSFTEGPSVLPDGKVYFTDQPNDKIFVWEEGQGIIDTIYDVERSNGTYADTNGILYSCADLHNRIVIITPEGVVKPYYESHYSGKHFNGPNDLWVDNKGGIYFTDPYYHRPWWPSHHKQELDVQGVYYLPPGGNAVRIIDDLEQPNGIAGTPDGKYLYVADIRAGKTWKYSINADGTLSNKMLFAPFGSDGMALDNKGNVYLTSGKVLVINPGGQKIAEIDVPESPSNVCFGGAGRNILFITARTSVYLFKMKVSGVE